MRYKKVYKPITEAQHQSMLLDWAEQPSIRSKWPELKLLYHIPNEGSGDASYGKRMKDQGVKRGVPDLHLPVSRGNYHSLYIELKREDRGETSQDQDWWIEELILQGNYCEVCHGWESARRVIEWYMTLPR